MKPFDQAWILLKRVGAGQYELGDFDLNFPHTQGPIVRYHGKHETPETTARINREGIVPFVDRDNLDEQGRPAGWESQVGPTYMFNDRDVPDAPLYTSVTRTRGTADDYASGRATGTAGDGNRTPTIYGVRAAALARRQDLDAPTRQVQHNALSDYYGGRGEYEFIRDGIKPEELHRFSATKTSPFSNAGSDLDVFEGPMTDGLRLTGNSPQAVFDRARQASMSEPGFASRDDMLQASRSMESQEQEMIRQWQEQQAIRQQQEAMRQASTQPQPPQGTQTTLGQFNQQGMM
tara:strand:- start:270 stop:1142 length:873 start_codon:yes stop_codon:yes gene_type:complete